MVRAVTGDPQPRDPRDDAALLRAHAAGDRDAFGELVYRHRDRLWAVALRTLGEREEAADALQDALLSAYRAAAGFRGDAAVTTWLHRIVVNACLDRVRRRQSRPTVPLPDVDLDRLADYVGGALDGTPEADAVADLVATDPRWSAAYSGLIDADLAVRSDLAAVAREPQPMPPDVLSRLTAALAVAPGVPNR